LASEEVKEGFPVFQRQEKRSMIVKRPTSVILFSLFEIFLGIAGTTLFMLSLDWSSIQGFHFIKTAFPDVYTLGFNIAALSLGMLYCLATLPYVLMFVAGIGVFALRPWAIKINLVIIPGLWILVVIFAFLGFPFFGYAVKWLGFCLVTGASLIFILFSVWFLTRPQVKQQFIGRA
jgi:hypothetical protein